MRIGIVAPPWLPVPPPGYGGTELVVDMLARGLADRGHDVELFTTGDASVPVRRVWEFEQALGTDATNDVEAEIRHLESAYRQLADCDVIHDHTIMGPRLQRATAHVVTTMHGTMDDQTQRWCRRYPRNVAIVAISASQRDSAPDIPFARVIHHGIELGGIETGSGAGGYFLFLGRMNSDKGVHTAIDVAREAGVPLVIAAKLNEPEEREYFSDVIEPMLTEDIRFVGEADNTRKQELLQGAVALLNPIQWREPFGMVMIESLAVGTPVVVTRCGAAPEIVEDGRSGFLCDTDESLVAACQRVGELSRTECRRAVEERFSAARMVADYESLFTALVEQGRPSGSDGTAVDVADLALPRQHQDMRPVPQEGDERAATPRV